LQIQQDHAAFALDPLGKSRLGKSADKKPHPQVYGRPSRTDRNAGDWTAADCMRGDAPAQQLRPAADVGKIAGFGKDVPVFDPTRRFGVPSIRTDVPARNGQSIASNVDYGDGVGASALLQASAYADQGIDEKDFAQPRSKKELAAIFGKIGVTLSTEAFESIYHHVSGTHLRIPDRLTLYCFYAWKCPYEFELYDPRYAKRPFRFPP
jgi:hypothetical protein